MLGRRDEAIKARLSASDTTNLGVHLIHLNSKMVQMTTKISTHELKLIHDGSDDGKYGFVSHTKHIAEATKMNLFHS